MYQTWDADAGQHISHFAEELLVQARRENNPVRGRHNDRLLVAWPDGTIDGLDEALGNKALETKKAPRFPTGPSLEGSVRQIARAIITSREDP